MSEVDFDIQTLPARQTELGALKILRALPRSQRRMVGAWCFLDRYGPLQFAGGKPMDVAPHPHMGLQTVSWLFEGDIIHHDSLGCEGLMRAGQLNLMTAGRGIAHSEETPAANSGKLSGVQLWVALPDEQRNAAPAFDHYASLPVLEFPGGNVTLIAGTLGDETSPAKTFSPIVGAEIAIHAMLPIVLPIAGDFEHALFVIEGDVQLNRQPIARDALHYLRTGREEMELSGSVGSRILLLGGEPFKERILMWWNFVARTHEEMAEAREQWMREERFGVVRAYHGSRLSAPDLSKLAPADPAS